MSLINKMLRDLDARQAPNVDRAGLPGALQPLPPQRAPRWPRLVAILLVGGAAVAVLQLMMPSVPQVKSVAVAPISPMPSPAPAPQPQAVAPLPSPEPPPLAAVAPPPEALEPAPPPLAPRPAIVTPPEKPESAPAAAKPRPAAPRAESRPPPPKPPSAATAAPALVAPGPPADAPPAAIDKRSRSTPTHEAAEAEYRKGMTALRRGTTSDAVASFRLALNLERRHVSARQALLAVLVEQQQWNEALALMEEGLALDPTQTGWAMTMARLQIERGKLAEAGETLARHAAHAERNADYLAFQAVVLQRQKRHADAAQRYRAALALRPSEARWWYGFGLALEAEHKAQEARAAFQQAHDAGNLPPELLAAVRQRLRLP